MKTNLVPFWGSGLISEISEVRANHCFKGVASFRVDLQWPVT